MAETRVPTTAAQTAWGPDLAMAACANCRATYLVPADSDPVRCPLCYQATLNVSELPPAGAPIPYLPELVLPFRLSAEQLEDAMRAFASGIPYASVGLNPAELRKRLRAVYLPAWLVDSAVAAYWQAETGYDYQVVSHREAFSQNLNAWKSSEVQEDRIRWENRVGRINRAYQNIATPALEDAARLEKQLGRFDQKDAQPYSPESIRRAFVRVPDRTRNDSWGEAVAAFQKTAAEDCRRACSAGHIRQFRWKARFTRQNWTLMLLPVYSTWYEDDEGVVHPVFLHGQTGAASGERRASARRASKVGLGILIISILMLLAGALLSGNEPANANMATLTTLLGVVGLVTMLASCIPYVTAWDFNRRQKFENGKS